MKTYKFRNLMEEAVRQFVEIKDSLQSSIIMSQVLVGLTAGFFSILFFQENLFSFKLIPEIFYVVEIILAGIFGLRAYMVRDYPIGVDVEKLYVLIKDRPELDERQYIFENINLANRHNRKILYEKNRYLKIGYVFYGFGILSFVIARVINLS